MTTRNDKNKSMSIDPNKGAQGGKNVSESNARAQQVYEKAQAKQARKKQKANEKRATAGGSDGAQGRCDKGVVAFVKGTIKELKLTTWPKPAELVRWCLIVIATVGVLAVGSMAIDNFVATPLLYWLSSLNVNTDGSFMVIDIILLIVLFLSGIGAVIGIYLHAGGDTEGLSDTVATRITGGSGQVQKNLDRITLVCIIVFALCLLAAMVVYPSGTLVTQ